MHIRSLVLHHRMVAEGEISQADEDTLDGFDNQVLEGFLRRCVRLTQDGSERMGVIEMIDLSCPERCFKVRFTDQDQHADWFPKNRVKLLVEERNPWFLCRTAELVLLMIMMPAVFAVLTIWSLIRDLEVFCGSTYRPPDSWKAYAFWRTSTYSADLTIAVMFQYVTIFAFTKLSKKSFRTERVSQRVTSVVQHLQLRLNERGGREDYQAADLEDVQAGLDRVEEDHATLALAGLQGLWSYIIVGVARSLLNIGMNSWALLHDGQFPQQGEEIAAKLQPVFFFVAAQCVYNWSILQDMPNLRGQFGKHSTKKFLGVRALLLIPDGQRPALQYGLHWLAIFPDSIDHQVDLLNAILLSLECLLIVGWNLWQWSPQENGSGRAPFSDERFPRRYTVPLLDS